MAFQFTRLDALPDVVLVEPRIAADARGFFLEAYRRSAFRAAGIGAEFVQDNHSRSARGVLRGLHYQKAAAAQGKLVRCVAGQVFDVAVDIRRGSPTYARWAGVELSAGTARQLWVPEGFAHGFCALTDGAEVEYKVTAEYSPEHDRAIRWDDPAIGIRWPIASPVLSSKDAKAPVLAEADNDLVWGGA